MTGTLYTDAARAALSELFRPGVARPTRAAVSDTLDRIESGEADDTPEGIDGVRATRVPVEAPELWVYWRFQDPPRVVLDVGPAPEVPDQEVGPDLPRAR